MTPPTVQFIPASGPTLIVHDDFAGTPGSLISGRTPNQVNTPGNSWLTHPNTTYYGIASSGTEAVAFNESTTSGMFIDVGTTTFDLDLTTEVVSTNHPWNWRHGPHIGFDNAPTAFSLLQIGDSGTTLQQQEFSGGIFTTTTLHTFAAVAINTDIRWQLSVSGTSVLYDVTVGGSALASGSITINVANGFPGWWSRHKESNLGAILKDFKVYT
jgi:hypothetical protein